MAGMKLPWPSPHNGQARRSRTCKDLWRWCKQTRSPRDQAGAIAPLRQSGAHLRNRAQRPILCLRTPQREARSPERSARLEKRDGACASSPVLVTRRRPGKVLWNNNPGPPAKASGRWGDLSAGFPISCRLTEYAEPSHYSTTKGADCAISCFEISSFILIVTLYLPG